MNKGEIVCPVCGYAMDAVTGNDRAPEPGGVDFCIDCTALLCFSGAGLEMLTPAQWASYPAEFRQELVDFAERLEHRPIADNPLRRHQHLIIPRGPAWRVGHLFANGLLLTGAPHSSRQSAQRELEASRTLPVTLTCGMHPDSRLWHAWAMVDALGQRTKLGAWGPFLTAKQAADEVLEVEAPKLMKQLGVSQLGILDLRVARTVHGGDVL